MKEWFEKLWHDPVWSKVIASLIITALALVYSVVKGWLSDTESVMDVIKAVFSYKVNIWLAAAIVVICLVVVSVAKKIRYMQSVKDEYVPRFVNEFVEANYQNCHWRWRWVKSSTYGFYYIADLAIVCPACNSGVLSAGYMQYKCGKCGAEIPWEWLSTDSDAVKKQILADTRHNYPDESEYVGELASGFVRNKGV